MPDERTYDEDEVAQIFEVAARKGAGPRVPAEGMTLAELQSIGSEVGLPPERIAEAATALELRRDATRATDFGLPVSVRRSVELPRAPTDREWEMLVADLRETFNARGREKSSGGIREWTNGNLHAYVEPTATGHRLRLGTTKGSATPSNRLGAVSLVVALVAFVMLFMAGQLPGEIMIPLIFAALGGGALTYNALSLPAWAREREEQMELVAARARALLSAAPEAPGGQLGSGEASGA
jgi:hypothetical protein